MVVVRLEEEEVVVVDLHLTHFPHIPLLPLHSTYSPFLRCPLDFPKPDYLRLLPPQYGRSRLHLDYNLPLLGCFHRRSFSKRRGASRLPTGRCILC